MEIILLVGKTTAAKLIAAEAFAKGFIPVLESFAGPIKQEALEKGYAKDKLPEKYRQYCQNRGAIARQESPDYWVDLMKERIDKICIQEKEDFNKGKKYWERVVIIDDCRYLNEVNYGIILKASLLFLSYGNRVFKNNSWRVHESEELANSIANGDRDMASLFDYIIKNDKSQKDFEEKIKSIIPNILGYTVHDEEDCGCPACTSTYEVTLGIEELLELLDFDNIDYKNYDEEDPDEET